MLAGIAHAVRRSIAPAAPGLRRVRGSVPQPPPRAAPHSGCRWRGREPGYRGCQWRGREPEKRRGGYRGETRVGGPSRAALLSALRRGPVLTLHCSALRQDSGWLPDKAKPGVPKVGASAAGRVLVCCMLPGTADPRLVEGVRAAVLPCVRACVGSVCAVCLFARTWRVVCAAL